MNRHHFLASLALLSAPLSAVTMHDIFPTPQQVTLLDADTRVTDVQINMRRPDSRDGMWAQIPADNVGAYALHIMPGKLSVWANSEEALHYAKQTLSQLLQGVKGAQCAQRDPFPEQSLAEVARQGKLPLGTILDWPDLPFRGTVEGYYGAPWSFEARKAQFDFYGRNKLNTYIYAPKDDPYHHGLGCYEPYPADKAEEIRQLVQHARRNHVRFVWAIHPANTVKWAENEGKNQLNALCHKLQLMYELGVRDFGVLVDDSSGEIGKAERQVQLCNYILEHFIRKHPDVNQTLIMCPTGYNKAWTNEKFLNTLGTGLDKSIPVMWTGDTVVHDITLSGQQWVNEQVKRPTFIWWNWPCNDFKRSRISMGRTYGLGTEPEMKSAMSGFVANPMEHAEASKVGIFGVADYTWNITGFESDKSWRAGIARLYPDSTEAMQCFCDHNSYLLPNTHKYLREESAQFAPVSAAYRKSLMDGKPNTADAATLQAEFERMENAGLTLQNAADTAELQKDIAPWLSQFILAGRAGAYAMKSIRSTNTTTRTQNFFRAVRLHADMQNTLRDEWTPDGTVYLKDTEVAMYHMTPAMMDTLCYLNAPILAQISGRRHTAPTFRINSTVSPRPGTSEARKDEVHRLQVGDTLCLNFGEPTDIFSIVLSTGRNTPLGKGQFEISANGRDWQPIGAPLGGNTLVLNTAEQPAQAAMLRYRVTEPPATPVSLREFSINRTLPPYTAHKLAKAPVLSAYRNEEHIGINRIMEVFSMAPGEYIELQIPGTIMPQNMLLNLGNTELPGWAEITLTHTDGTQSTVRGVAEGEWLIFEKEQLPNKAITAVRLTHKGNLAQEIKLTYFRLGLSREQADLNPLLLTDGDLTTFYNNGKAELKLSMPLPLNTKKIIVVGTADYTINDAQPTGGNEYMKEFAAPTGDGQLRICAPQQEGQYTYEVIFVH
ncbi:MAG: beta-N-acetylglucosaminidase domain-containing protein [Akkermansia sp.]|nr:beta-N-acetylglucosaminidase domain-containing protein [Akkermansia sp.]